MPSPFPGMDPYLESWIWADFHATLITATRAQINAKLPRRYLANTELYVWREGPSENERLLLGGPDIHAVEKSPAGTKGPPVATVVPPVTTILPGVERKQRYVRIVDESGRRIVTVIEILSPSNKTAHESGEAYRYKREEYIASGVNLVEIDLLRAGVRPPLGDPAPSIPDYYALVSRAWQRPQLDVWPFSVRDPLPHIPVPLDPEEPEVLLDMGAAFARAFEEGRYEEQVDYSKPPKPAFREPDATWARELLAARSNR
jgi:hypothetical protein